MICSNLLEHVHEIEYKCMWAVKWVASNPQMVDRDAPITNLQGQQTKHIKSKVVWFSVPATFYQLRRVLDNAACSGKCRQNFSSIPLRPKIWQHESIGIYIYMLYALQPKQKGKTPPQLPMTFHRTFQAAFGGEDAVERNLATY